MESGAHKCREKAFFSSRHPSNSAVAFKTPSIDFDNAEMLNRKPGPVPNCVDLRTSQAMQDRSFLRFSRCRNPRLLPLRLFKISDPRQPLRFDGNAEGLPIRNSFHSLCALSHLKVLLHESSRLDGVSCANSTVNHAVHLSGFAQID